MKGESKMKVEILCTGETKTGKRISHTYTSHVTSVAGQNRALENRHKQFYHDYPKVDTTRAIIISNTVFA
jgi:hypothetical protein